LRSLEKPSGKNLLLELIMSYNFLKDRFLRSISVDLKLNLRELLANHRDQLYQKIDSFPLSQPAQNNNNNLIILLDSRRDLFVVLSVDRIGNHDRFLGLNPSPDHQILLNNVRDTNDLIDNESVKGAENGGDQIVSKSVGVVKRVLGENERESHWVDYVHHVDAHGGCLLVPMDKLDLFIDKNVPNEDREGSGERHMGKVEGFLEHGEDWQIVDFDVVSYVSDSGHVLVVSGDGQDYDFVTLFG
jgi:hypothetical protein